MRPLRTGIFFFFNDTATTEIYTLSLHDALPISYIYSLFLLIVNMSKKRKDTHCNISRKELRLIIQQHQHQQQRSEEHTSELQSQSNLVCRLLLEKKQVNTRRPHTRARAVAARRR